MFYVELISKRQASQSLINQNIQIKPTTPANMTIGLFRNYLNTIAVSKRECDHGKRLETSSIKTYASCVNCFIRRIAKARPLNKVLHDKFLKRVEKTDRSGALRKRVSMDRNGLKIFKEFYEMHCKGKYPDEELYVYDPNLEIIEPETIVFKQGDTTEKNLHDNYRRQFVTYNQMVMKLQEKISRVEISALLKEYDDFRLHQVHYNFLENNGIDMELVLANTSN
tara:strand:+ start:2184 stop:2855 length:672 start_codon:yes stop_codon:yes gene_type:complete